MTETFENEPEENLFDAKRTEHVIKVGQRLNIFRPGTGLLDTTKIDFVYSGMSETQESFYITAMVHDYQSLSSAEIRYPSNIEEIIVLEDKFRVVKVNPDLLILNYLGKFDGGLYE